jgi:hypothetical protein
MLDVEICVKVLIEFVVGVEGSFDRLLRNAD